MATSLEVTSTRNQIPRGYRANVISQDDYEESPTELIALLGLEKFHSLMECVEHWTHSEFQINVFQKMWTNNETADNVLKYLERSTYMFQSFITSFPGRQSATIGRLRLCQAFAVEKFGQKTNKKIDLLILL